jgi:cysteinyl-tRNA synthetase
VVLERCDAESLRFFLLRVSYRSPFNYSEKLLEESATALARLYTALRDVAPDDQPLDWSEAHAVRFREAMDDDFNTPIAVAVLFDLATQTNRSRAPSDARKLALDTAAIDQAVEARSEAKRSRNFAEADRIRADLLAQGVVLEDSPTGTKWRKQ